jgi:MoaA/NifB/PqqE/SkfB family radical SAM enzyme
VSLIQANLHLPTYPFKLSHCLTYSCQSRCLTCNIWRLRPKNELSLPEISEFAFKNPNFGWINLTGGEPFLRDDIVEIAGAYAESSHPYLLSLITNGLCSPDDVAEKVQEMIGLCPRMVMSLSLDGTENVHDHVRGIPGNYRRVIDLAKELIQFQSAGFHLIFSYTMSRFNEGKLSETVDAVGREIGQDPRFEVNLAQNSEEYYHNLGVGISPSRSSVIRDIRSLKKRWDMMGLLEQGFLRGLERYLETNRMPVQSAELSNSLYLDSYGNVWPSIMWNERLGNIRDTSYCLEPIWNGDRAEELRELVGRGEGPQHWTRCEAYPSLLASIPSLIR